ncbi:vitamin K epoxide reductase family protein [Draconibacterium mangrovi]|uniref:vitamin K epoxide reductase family protein n=1 Tax=Draconibacterium mangrovi TaxID=2697469 RepID=UPI0013D15D1E|nr:vitamin K epoxide reductase family protein [Draconibacterium mangrovi]
MLKSKEDNVIFILQKAIKHFKIKVTNTSVKEFLLAHPHYPSLKSVCDALKKWKVDHYALNLELDEIRALEMPFIAHLKTSGGQLVFVEKINYEQVTYFVTGSGGVTEEFEKFAERMSGAIVVMEGSKISGEKEYSYIRQNEFLNKSLLPIGVITLLVLVVLSFTAGSGSLFPSLGFHFFGLLASKIVGLTASIFLVLHELKVHTPLADKICGFGSKTDCDTVLSSKASKLFGWINWADTGLVFFSGSLIFLLDIPENNTFGLLAIISALSMPYPVFSIYYQSVKLKKWCPFCLLVQVILIAEFIILFPSLKFFTFSGIELLQLIVSFLVPASIWLTFKAFYHKSTEQKKEHYLFLQFKRNPDIFLHLLKGNGFTEFQEDENSLILGNPNAKLTVTAFLSPYCNPCASAFNKLKNLLENCPDIKINAVFSVYNDEESKKLINTLYSTYIVQGAAHTVDFLDKWYSLFKQNRKSIYANDISKAFDIAKQIEDKNKALFEKYKVEGTPTIYVNGYKFSTQYDYNDIELFIDDIIQLTRESKRQEACVNCH